ncbi:hypothetical protein GQ457_05G020000 [Hibiscus cannabinus]
MVLHKTGYRYSRVGIDTHLGYLYSIRVSVLKNHSGILEVFQNLTGYRYSMKGIGTDTQSLVSILRCLEGGFE